MAFRVGAFATVWEVKPATGNYTDVRISTSRKNQQTNEYEQDFAGFVRMIGDAHSKAGMLKEKSRIRIGDCAVTNSYNKEKNVTYTNFQVFTFEPADGSASTTNAPAQQNTNKATFMDIPDGISEELPFN